MPQQVQPPPMTPTSQMVPIPSPDLALVNVLGGQYRMAHVPNPCYLRRGPGWSCRSLAIWELNQWMGDTCLSPCGCVCLQLYISNKVDL